MCLQSVYSVQYHYQHIVTTLYLAIYTRTLRTTLNVTVEKPAQKIFYELLIYFWSRFDCDGSRCGKITSPFRWKQRREGGPQY